MITPRHRTKQYLFRTALSTALLLWTATAAALEPPAVPPATALPTLLDFFGNSVFGGARLSPDGRNLAIRQSLNGEQDVLIVIELDKMQGKVVARDYFDNIGNFQWINENRLVYDLYGEEGRTTSRFYGPGLYAVNRDGKGRVQLAVRGDHSAGSEPWNTYMLYQGGGQDSSAMYVHRTKYDFWNNYVGSRLRRIDTLTGAAEFVPGPQADAYAYSYILDFNGQPRLARSSDETSTTFHYLDPKTGKWRELIKYANYGSARDQVHPVGFGPDGTLYVAAYAGENTSSLRTFDFATGAVSKHALLVTPGYDFDGSLVMSSKVLGVKFTTDAESNVWFDPAMQAIQDVVDKALPVTNNMITVPNRGDSPWMMVESYSDMQPTIYSLFDTRTGQVQLVGKTHPNILNTAMARQKVFRYKARDGMEIPVLLTMPTGGVKQNLPMVVLVHGGPWMRGASWGWNADSQFLASRGYAVLEVEFRGSLGFGLKHFEAGFKQWGLAMQNDVADGTRWAIAQGIADPKRICIAGASYGGYAVLMGLVNDPDLYRCGINWIGVTDIELMYTGNWFSGSDLSTGYLKHGMPVMIGDRGKDAAQLKATSPIQQAARIHQPLLLAYGGEDKRVPIVHGERFRAAVTQTNKQVEWVEYDEEGHGWSKTSTRIDFWGRVEKFLDQHIGPQQAVSGASADAR